MGNTSSHRCTMLFIVSSANLLCRRGALAFLSPPTAAPQFQFRALRHRSFHSLVRSPPSISSTRFSQSDSSDNDNDSTKPSIEPTWTYTPYKPPPQRPIRRNNFSTTTEWIIPDPIPIPQEALTITFVRSSGAGGQNVNKLNTKVSLSFHVDSSSWLPLEVRDRLKSQEAHRINNEGVFSLSCQEYRTQIQNRKEIMRKLQSILRECWKRPKVRKMRKGLSQKTKENRMEMKRRVKEKKGMRGRVDF
jgi:hypothetical protein